MIGIGDIVRAVPKWKADTELALVTDISPLGTGAACLTFQEGAQEAWFEQDEMDLVHKSPVHFDVYLYSDDD